MGRKLHVLIGTLKDTASITKATLTTAAAPTSTTQISPDLAVLRATTHHPSFSPPHPRHVAALLSFGHASRLSASSLINSLSSRLSSTRDPSVALKCLLCLHYLLSQGSFILFDTLSSSLIPSSGRRSPLNLSSFRDRSSLSLSSWVRFYARLLELLLSVKLLRQSEYGYDRLTTLLNRDLIAELNSIVGVVEELDRAPDMLTIEQNGLVMEVVRLVEEDRDDMHKEIQVRIQEVKGRLGELGFGDSIEMVCLIRRLEECRGNWNGWDLFWSEVREVRERVGEVVVREEEEKRGRRRREGGSESTRIGDRVRDDSVRFGSTRWLHTS